ncbi:MAG TPA: hypothetical protein VFR68_09500, partial [Candidatus Dormibacteraeota bacterium]|nr:hypothetical protein [Candidatus Dormibacteraeota bacterium]
LGAAATIPVIAEPLTQGVEPDALSGRLSRRPNNVSVWLRLVMLTDDADAIPAMQRLLASTDVFDVVSLTLLDRSGQSTAGTPELWRSLRDVCQRHSVKTLLADVSMSEVTAALGDVLAAGASGFVLRSRRSEQASVEGGLLRTLRQRYPRALLVAACGATSPREILGQFDEGAQLVAVDVGLIEAGPLLAKRGNEALAGRRSRLETITAPKRAAGTGWPWAMLLGAGMLIAGLAVFVAGLTRVVLPYDEAFLGISQGALSDINPRLLAFMRHDRITLAATMLSIGILYLSLALNGLRNGWLWARGALLGSGVVGFASLFLFLGFHYVDPLHVTLSAGLFPLLLLGVLLPTRKQVHESRDLDNDASWRLGITGQLFFIGLAIGLILAGVTITVVGATRVFVFSDLAFLRTTASVLSSANNHLLPLIAHDRAGFGGALASDGVAVLLISLWGFRRGERWVWWTLFLAGLAGLAGGVYAHVSVGYLEFGHLLPLFVSAVVFVTGLAFSSAFLLRRRPLGV